MSLFESASLVVTPNGTKAYKLYAVVPENGAGDLTVTRNTTSTRVNSSNVVEVVAANVPRLDYTNSTCPSILIEPQRSNIFLNSAVGVNQAVLVVAQQFTVSFYGTGTISLSGTHNATLVGTGTTRKTYTFTPTVGFLVFTITGTVTNVQCEAGAYATSYIPTGASLVTRNADLISKTGISSLLGQTEGTVFMKTKVSALNQLLATITSAAGNLTNRLQVSIDPAGRLVLVRGDFSLYILSSTTYPVGTNLKVAFVYKANDFKIYANGVQVASSVSGNIPPTPSVLYIGQFVDGSISQTASFENLSIWKTRLTNTQLAELTTL